MVSRARGSCRRGDGNITAEQCNRFDFIQAYKTTWGLHCPGAQRGRLLNKLADLLEQHIDEFAALEALDVGENPEPARFPFFFALELKNTCLGKVFAKAKAADIGGTIAVIRYYAGWADKIQGKTIEVTRHRPVFCITQFSQHFLDQRDQICLHKARTLRRCGEHFSTVVQGLGAEPFLL